MSYEDGYTGSQSSEIIPAGGSDDDQKKERPQPEKTAETEAMAIVRDLFNIYFKDGRPVAPPTDAEGIMKDGIKMMGLVQRAKRLVGEGPWPDSPDSKTSSTGEKSRETTTALPEGDAGSDSSPSARSTSSPNPEDKPAGDPR